MLTKTWMRLGPAICSSPVLGIRRLATTIVTDKNEGQLSWEAGGNLEKQFATHVCTYKTGGFALS